jgi:predicted acetyltransferase
MPATMSLTMRWVGEAEYDRVAEARMLCYAPARRELEGYRQRLRADPRVGPRDCLLAERGGRAVGTATSLSLRTWVRGGAVPCQGVASVGTVPTHRRAGASSGEAGVATQVMREVLNQARERGDVVSALMPFRGSFYEHFGYGIIERRLDWTVPLGILPAGSSEGIRYFEPGDLPALVACRQRVAERGQCDIERSPALWQRYVELSDDGFLLIDRPNEAGPVHGWMFLQRQHLPDGRDVAKAYEIGYESVASLGRFLHFLAGLRDQYSAAVLPLAGDLPLNRLLREVQMTHRDNRNHPTAEARPYTRMQLRVLDHKRFVEAMTLPPVRGAATVAIHETEGHESRLRIEMSGGRAEASAAAAAAAATTPDFACRDHVWATIACGDLTATRAVELGLAESPNLSAATLLDSFATGPAPFTLEYF